MKKKRDRALLTGNKATSMFGDMLPVAERLFDCAGDNLIAQHDGDVDKAFEAARQILLDSKLLMRVIEKLEAGKPDEAEKLILKGVKGNG